MSDASVPEIGAQTARMLEAKARSFEWSALHFYGHLQAKPGLRVFDESAWYTCSAGDEYYSAQEPTEEAALQIARNEHWPEIVRAARQLTAFSIDVDSAIEWALEGDLELEVGEDGQHGLLDVSQEAIAELQKMVDAAVGAWLIRHNVRAFLLHEIERKRVAPE